MDYILGEREASGSQLSLSDVERRQHIHVIGQSGSGKSALLYNLMRADFARARPFALLDPHGDLALALADAAPKELVQDTIYFDPLAAKVPTYNPLFVVPPLYRGTVASHVVSSFKHIWAGSWGPRLEYIFLNAVRLLLDNPRTTLVDLPRLLVDDRFRATLLRKCSDTYITSFWTEEYARYSDKLKAEAIAPLQNKVGSFANNPILRAIIGQPSTIDIADAMNGGKTLLVNLSKHMGEDVAQMLGSLIVTGFAQAAYDRHTIPEAERKDFTLYADEFQSFATESFAHILSEARKYRLNLVLAHQYLDQLPDDLRHAVMGNTGTMVVFRVGAYDAPPLSRQLGIPEQALTTLPNYKAFVRTLSGGTPATVSVLTLPPKRATGSLQSVLNLTEHRYARPRKE